MKKESLGFDLNSLFVCTLTLLTLMYDCDKINKEICRKKGKKNGRN